MSMYDFNQEQLTSLKAATGNPETGSSSEKKEGGKKDTYEWDMYDERNNLPESVMSTYHMKATDLCSMITGALRGGLPELKGCSFRPGMNGLLEFILIFQRNNTVQKDKRNLISIIGDNDNKLAKFVTQVQTNHNNGRRTLTLSDEAKGLLEPFMVRNIVTVNGRQELAKVDWNKCIQEIEYAVGQNFGIGNFETYIIVSGINVESILNNMFTPTSQKETDKDNAKRSRNGIVKPRYQYKIVFRGYRNFDAYNNIIFTQQRMVTNNFGQIQVSQQFTLQDYFLNIERYDTDTIENIIPKQINYQNGPEYY